MVLYLWAISAAGLTLWAMLRKNRAIPPLAGILSFVLPFAVGGFHGYTAAATALLLLAALSLRCQKNGGLVFSFDLTGAALGTVLLSVSLSPLWAVDKGMAIFGLLPWLPVALYWLYLAQCTGEERRHALDLLPLSGAVMAAVSVLLLLLPELRRQLTVNGRLAGFFQYPNTFAAFLLAGFVLCAGQKQTGKHFAVLTLLVWGIVLSGSRTAFLLLITAAVGIVLQKRSRSHAFLIASALIVGILLGHAVQALGLMAQADRYLQLEEGGTFFARLLYWQDALPLICKNPLGLGYLGWRSLQGTVQTGRYFTTYLHNGLLQLMLDVGWIPAILLFLALLRGLLSKELPGENRLLLALLLAYSLMDFHTEYPVIWVILLSTMPHPCKKQVLLKHKKCMLAACVAVGAICLWLGSAQALYYSANVDACLALAPFHSDAVEAKLSWSEPEQQPALAERLLALDENRSRAWNAKAYVARDRGDWDAMILCKETAIRHDRYHTEQYTDYVNCLFEAMQICLGKGQDTDAWTLAEKILTVPQMMEAVNNETSALAHATGDDNTLFLPEAYQDLMAQLEAVIYNQ